MSEIEKLVPPLELCKNIDQNEFAGSALAWFISINGKRWVAPRGSNRIENGELLFAPAPTLVEIMEALPKYDQNENSLACVPDFDDYSGIFGGAWDVGYTAKNCRSDKSAAAAALRLWLEVRG